jgi:excisionase family DNA binding protein
MKKRSKATETPRITEQKHEERDPITLKPEAGRKLLRVSEVANLLDVTLPRAYEMARHGIIPVVRLGRQLRVDPDRLAEWINRGGTRLDGGWRHESQ